MTGKTLLREEKNGVLVLTLNRPERRNALTPELCAELIDALETAREDAPIVTLTGSGAAFCAGLDLTALEALSAATPVEQQKDAGQIARLFRLLYTFPAPTIAAVNGAAIAGGTGLATLCDFTLAVPEAKFGYTEVRIGFVPALVSAYLEMQTGAKQAKRLLIAGSLFDTAQAKSLGLVDEIVAPEKLMERAAQLAGELQKNSPAAMRLTKQLFLEETIPELDRRIALALAANVEARKHPDFHEGITAFLEKRKPAWSKSAKQAEK